ncbi:uncharacterized protein GGS25DRAFT_485786 [Hypoxylon fragiforme]|uniref:uncharacterized protein n=1 Tax=Hypoxylon fragiforme TaxID=63214 RepID=UPI0020C608BF|nr:uncharacterized protein GGS25DRAFT_485786 [Hypoxylon fragiforme]KAI2609688.1 hypothetical protein GGS25DRAFT_485786 [Hypoxylon fragiforme]
MSMCKPPKLPRLILGYIPGGNHGTFDINAIWTTWLLFSKLFFFHVGVLQLCGFMYISLGFQV